MGPSPRVRVAMWMLSAVAAFSSGERGARAQEEPEPIRLDYRAQEGCPGLDDFVARVRARTKLVRPAWPGEEARSFHVTLEAGPPARGDLAITGDTRPPGSRGVHAATCAEAADALSMVVALAADARLAAQEPPPPPTAPVETSPVPAAVAPPARAPVGAAEDAREPVPAAPQRPTERPSAEAPPPNALFLGGDFVVVTGVTSTALLSVSPYVGWRAPRATWAPSLRLAFIRDQSGPFDVAGGGRATFTWTVGRVDACTRPWPRMVVDVSACARVEAGAFEATGTDIAAPLDKLRPWLAAGPLVRLEWSFASTFFVDADLGAQFRVTDDQFVFLPDVTVYRVPVVGVSTGAGVGVRFL